METENIQSITEDIQPITETLSQMPVLDLTKEEYTFLVSLLQQVPLPSVPLAQMPTLSEKVVAIINKCVELSK